MNPVMIWIRLGKFHQVDLVWSGVGDEYAFQCGAWIFSHGEDGEI